MGRKEFVEWALAQRNRADLFQAWANLLRHDSGDDLPKPDDLTEAMKMHIQDVLERNSGNKTEAAKALGMDRATLYRWLLK